MLVIVQLVGGLLVLAPFAAHQFGKANAGAPACVWPNLIGSAALTVLAAIGGQWGFLLLKAAWAAVAARSVGHERRRDRRPGRPSVSIGRAGSFVSTR
jgi:hypothetical protein